MSISVLNTDAGLSGKTIINAEDTQTVSGNKNFSGTTTLATVAGTVTATGAWTIQGTTTLSGTTVSAGRLVVSGTIGTATTAVDIQPSISPSAGASAGVLYVGGTLVEAGSGTHTVLSGSYFAPPTITGAAATTTNAATVYIHDAPTGGTNNYALMINSGNSRIPTLTLGSSGTAITLDATGAAVEILASGHDLHLSSNTNVVVKIDKNNNGSNFFYIHNGGGSTVVSIDENGTPIFVGNTAIPAGGTAGLGVRLSTTANFGVFFGSGAPSLSAAQGSLYLRSDGSSTSTRAYINTDGGTTWTAITTAA